MQNETTGLLSPGAHEVAVDGLNQRYHVHGSGPVCLAIPGGPGVNWESLRAPALEESLTMVYVEPLGTGGSQRLPSHPNGYTRERHTRSVIGLLDRLSLPRVFLLGHSHGGFVAQHVALHHPDRLRGLVLYESAPVTGPEHMAEAATRVEEFAHRNEGRPELPAALAAFQSIGAITDDEKITAALRDLLPIYFARYWDREDEFRGLRETITCTYISPLDKDGEPDVIDDRATLPKLTVPTLIVVGRHDVICGPRWAQGLHTLIPQSQLVMLENSGHLGHVEEPEAFAGAVRAFVESTIRSTEMNRDVQSATVAFAGDLRGSSSVEYGVLVPVEVYFDDLDVFGMLHNSRYQVLVERGWTAYWLGQGVGGESGRDGDAFGVVKQVEVVFDMPVTRIGSYGVHFWVERVGRTSAMAGYRLCSLDGATTYAHGTRTIVRLDPATMRPTPWSDRAREMLRAALKPLDTTTPAISH